VAVAAYGVAVAVAVALETMFSFHAQLTFLLKPTRL
jgi:hypothetical protein